MPFSSTASVTATDMNNNLRGLYRDNADHAVTGTVAETDLASTSITGNTIGATGGLHIIAGGTTTGVAGAKTIRFYFGGTVVATLALLAAQNDDWMIEAFIYNTASNAQRILYRLTSGSSATAVVNNHLVNYTTLAIDTTANQTVKITGQLANVGDTITETMFDFLVIQIT